MLIGVLREIRAQENRVSMTPAGVEVVKQHGHTVLVEQSAGAGSDFADTQYAVAGATIMGTPGEIYARADLVMHVKEPLPPESRFYDLPNVIFSPHISGDMPEYELRATEVFSENLRRYLAGEPFLHEVDQEKEY